ncbi:hypothetical protein [Tsukamurella strandjordii]|uniref:hypothetical protein n=1 Tax=Tsukamurella strandjordii TaxID=147577 RepID=UPI0031E3FA47
MPAAPSAIRIELDRVLGAVPMVVVDGMMQTANLNWLVVPVTPGVHRVAVTETYPTTQGWVNLDVPVAPGQMATVYYTSPHMGMGYGRIGLVPQSRPGAGTATVVWSLAAIPAVMLLAVIAIALWIVLA